MICACLSHLLSFYQIVEDELFFVFQKYISHAQVLE